MVYKKLQDLVDTALYDDVITAEEEARLMARAREMGQDIDEFKSYLEGRKNSRAEWVAKCKKEKEEDENRPTLKLAERISHIEGSTFWDTNEEKRREIREALGKVITPTNQESLFELANFLFSKYSYGKFKDLYKARLTECINKGVFSFPSDERFKSLENAFKQKELNRLKTVGILTGSLVVIILIIIIIANVL